MTTIINKVTVEAPDGMDMEEQLEYVKLERKHYPEMTALKIEADGEYVNLTITSPKRPFERIRRITGYLVGGMERWNNAKKAEEADRVKHGLET